MNFDIVEYRNPFIRFLYKIKYLWQKIWSSKFYTFLFLLVILFSVLVFVMAYPAYFNAFINDASDDILQYYPYVGGFFEKIKEGSLSLYDKNLILGASFFSGLYYIPLDIFTFIAFLFNYIIPGEIAYAGTNVLRIIAGSLILYYVLQRHLSNKAAFFGAIILFISGMVEAYYIFPIYLGILTYAPLAMLIVDLCVEKKGIFYLLVPIYVAIVVFFDFYMAYMLIAFLCIYYVVKCHIDNEFSFFRRNTIFANGKFWLRFLEFMAMVFLGLAISMFILMPSALYILNESNRQSSNINESIWYFSKNVDGKNVISWRHYYTQLINLFIPNEPHRFCLVEAGDYVREHASLYLTSGGLIYLVSFFFIFKRRENRLKIWVVLFNILLLIPLFSMILGLNTSPYVRWFFIPYMLNIYAMALGMDHLDFKLSQHNLLKLIPMAILSGGVFLILFTLINKPDLYIHYHSDDICFYPILIGSLIFTSSYLVILGIWLLFKLLKKDSKIFVILIQSIIFVEVVFGGVFIFCNVGNANAFYINTKTVLQSQKAQLKAIGYDEKDGYRINSYGSGAWSLLNANSLIGMNFGRYFQSFYPIGINTLYSDIYMDTSKDWGRVFNFGYGLINGQQFNTKYIVTEENIELPEKYYNKETYGNTNYYTLKDAMPFIVYDKGYTTPYSLGTFERQVSLLNYAYIYKPTDDLEYYKEHKMNYEPFLFDSYGSILDSKFEIVSSSKINTYLSQYIKHAYVSEYNIEYDEYRVYDLTPSQIQKAFADMDAVYVWSNSSKLRKEDHAYYYLREKNPNNPDPIDTADKYGTLHNMHYNEMVLGEYTPHQLLVQYKNNDYTAGVDIYTYKYELYDNFIEEQKQYENKVFSLDGDTMIIKCNMPDASKTRIIKTGFAYSKDWVIADSRFETVTVNGAFLGILVPEGIDNVDITLKFKPTGYYEGLSISLAGCSIYLVINIITLGVIIIKRRKEIE